jgi:hypothetical protein
VTRVCASELMSKWETERVIERTEVCEYVIECRWMIELVNSVDEQVNICEYFGECEGG